MQEIHLDHAQAIQKIKPWNFEPKGFPSFVQCFYCYANDLTIKYGSNGFSQ
jgi:hypothetical protein